MRIAADIEAARRTSARMWGGPRRHQARHGLREGTTRVLVAGEVLERFDGWMDDGHVRAGDTLDDLERRVR